MSDLLSMLRHELRSVPGQISTQAAALCKIVWHQFEITWQHQGDQHKDLQRLAERVKQVESRLAQLEAGKHPE